MRDYGWNFLVHSHKSFELCICHLRTVTACITTGASRARTRTARRRACSGCTWARPARPPPPATPSTPRAAGATLSARRPPRSSSSHSCSNPARHRAQSSLSGENQAGEVLVSVCFLTSTKQIEGLMCLGIEPTRKVFSEGCLQLSAFNRSPPFF